MALARLTRKITDEAGNILPNVQVEIRREAEGQPLANLYADRDGAVPVANPVASDAHGEIAVHMVGGAYKLTPVGGIVERFVGVGTAQEADLSTLLALAATGSIAIEGTYDNSQEYELYDTVLDQGSTWIFTSSEPSIGVAPPTLPDTSNDQWQLVARRGEGLEWDAAGPFADRGLYDDAAVGFVYLSIDGDGAAIDTPVFFELLETDPAVWSDPIPLPTGPQGASPHFKLRFSSTTTEADPGSGQWRRNDASSAGTTFLFIDHLALSGANIQTFLQSIGDDDELHFVKLTDAGVEERWRLTGNPISALGYTKIPVALVSTAGSFVSGDDFALGINRGAQLTPIHQDIRRLAMEVADLVGDRLNMANGIADPFDDQTDVDVAASSNEMYDAAGDYFYTAPQNVSLSYLGSNQIATDTNSYTFSAENLGAAAADRVIVVGIFGTIGGAIHQINSVTIGGVAATAVAVANDTVGTTTQIAALYRAAVPSGATGDVVITFSGTVARCSIAKWRMTGALVPASDTGTDTTGAGLSTDVDRPAGGAVIAYTCASTTNIGAVTWTGIDENVDETVENTNHRHSGASSVSASAQAGLVVSATYGNAPSNSAMAVAAFAPSAFASMDLRSVAFTAAAQPSVARFHAQLQLMEAATVNVDFKAYVSRDNGTTWTEAVLVEVGQLADGTKLFEDDAINVSAQPAGTSMKWRFTTAKNIRNRGVLLQWG